LLNCAYLPIETSHMNCQSTTALYAMLSWDQKWRAVAVLPRHNMDQQRHTVCSLQPIIEHRKYLFDTFADNRELHARNDDDADNKMSI